MAGKRRKRVRAPAAVAAAPPVAQPAPRAVAAPNTAPPAPGAAITGPRDSLEMMRLCAALPLVQGLPKHQRGDFRRAAEEAPFLLRSLGLGAGLSTLAAKGGGRQQFAGMLACWLLRDCPPGDASSHSVADALARISAGDRANYRVAQIEAIGFATSLKRLAQALCPKDATDG